MTDDKLARETKRGDELLTGGSESDGLTEREEALKAAYMAGYLERELDVREDDRRTIQIAKRKAEHWIKMGGPAVGIAERKAEHWLEMGGPE